MKSNIFWNRGNKTVILNPILSSAEVSFSTDSVGSVTLGIEKERMKDFKIQIGDLIIIPYMNDPSKVLFRGKIFKINTRDKTKIEIKAYNILKYLQGKKYNVFPTIDLGSIVKVICADLGIEYGYLEKTPNCPAKLFTDKSYGDILNEYESYLLYMNGVKYVHRVENNQLTLRNLENLMTNYLITDDITTSHSYTESAEDVKNVVEVFQEVKTTFGTSKKSTGEYKRYLVSDKESIDKLGVLITSIKADDDSTWEQIVEKAKNTLFINKQHKYELSFTIPALALLNLYDIIKTNIDKNPTIGYINEISWNLIDEETSISLAILGK